MEDQNNLIQDNEPVKPEGKKVKPESAKEEPTGFQLRLKKALESAKSTQVVVYSGDKIQVIPAAHWNSRHKTYQKQGYKLAQK